MDQSKTRVVIIVNPQGIHLRPADLFAKLANKFQSNIEVQKGYESFDGKSVLSVLTLAAQQGTELTLKASGPDAEEALAALAQLVERGFDEMNPAN